MIFPNGPIVVDFVSPLAGGFTTSEKYKFVSWNEEVPKIWLKKNMFQTTNQSSSISEWHGKETIRFYPDDLSHDIPNPMEK